MEFIDVFMIENESYLFYSTFEFIWCYQGRLKGVTQYFEQTFILNVEFFMNYHFKSINIRGYFFKVKFSVSFPASKILKKIFFCQTVSSLDRKNQYFAVIDDLFR